jgi:hypothetical protein
MQGKGLVFCIFCVMKHSGKVELRSFVRIQHTYSLSSVKIRHDSCLALVIFLMERMLAKLLRMQSVANHRQFGCGGAFVGLSWKGCTGQMNVRWGIHASYTPVHM